MAIPYFVFLIVYLAVVLVFLILAFFNMYHLVKFGLFTPLAKTVAALFVLASLAIIIATIYLLKDIDWQQSLTIFSL